MKIAQKSGRGAISFSLFGFAEPMDGVEYKNRVTMRHSMQKIQNKAPPIGSAKQITTLEITPPRASFADFSSRGRKVSRREAVKLKVKSKVNTKRPMAVPRNCEAVKLKKEIKLLTNKQNRLDPK